MIDDKVLAELERLEKAATPGPWDEDWVTGAIRHIVRNVDYDAFTTSDWVGWQKFGDSPFILALRTHAAALLAEARAAKVLREEVRAWRALDIYADVLGEASGDYGEPKESDAIAIGLAHDVRDARSASNSARALGGDA